MTLSVGVVAALTLAGCHTGPSAGVSAAADSGRGDGAAFRSRIAPGGARVLAAVTPSDPAQASVAGELALQRGDCRTAADDFAVASQGATAQMASHATEVALDCQNIPAAWIAAQNWLKAAPKDPQAALVYATVALKLYHVPEARAAIATALAADAKATDRALIERHAGAGATVRCHRGLCGAGSGDRHAAALGHGVDRAGGPGRGGL